MTDDSGKTTRRSEIQRKQQTRRDRSRSCYAEAQYSQNVVSDYDRNQNFDILFQLLFIFIHYNFQAQCDYILIYYFNRLVLEL